MSVQRDHYEELHNPIDSVEEILSSNNWVFSRMNDDELMVQVHGRACEYKIFFLWQEDRNALQFCCQYEVPVSDTNLATAAQIVLGINESLWMGHFDLPRETGTPVFRYTSLLTGMSRASGFEQIQDLVGGSLAQCEKFYPLFHLLSLPQTCPADILNLAIAENAGHS